MAKYKMVRAMERSYGGTRSLDKVKYIVLHYTGNDSRTDTAKAECHFFAHGNQRNAGAHFFVDQYGLVLQSIPMKRIAWSVGGFFTLENGAGKYYKKCLNANSVSIEMCDCASRDPSPAMTEAIIELIKYIQSKCPNAKTVIRHFDVNGKCCPARFAGANNARWKKFRETITGAKQISTVTPAKTKSKKKSNTEIAKEVINGKWGNGDARKKKLKAAGYDPSEIQKLVNKMLK